MAAAKMWKISGGFKTDEEYTCGTDIPRVLHQGYSGKFQSETIYTTDDTLAALAFPATRDQVITVISVDKDTSSPQGVKTVTFTLKVYQWQRNGPSNANGVVKSTLEGTLTALPTGV